MEFEKSCNCIFLEIHKHFDSNNIVFLKKNKNKL
jgi:hypothetical protein